MLSGKTKEIITEIFNNKNNYDTKIC